MQVFFTAVLATMLMWFSYPLSAYAHPDDGDDNEEEVIDITVDPAGTPVTRSEIPVSAFYVSAMNRINITFLHNIGDVTIRLTNLTTGYMISTVVDSSVGSYILPVTGGTGLYKLSFITEDGAHYSGFFNVL